MKKSLLFLCFLISFSISSTGQFGNYAIDIAASEYIEVPDNIGAVLDIEDGFTIEAWIFTGNAQSNQKVAGKIGGDFINGFILGIQDGQVNMEVFDNSNTQIVLQSGVVPDTMWTHIAGTYEVGGMMTIYINGKNVGQTAASGGVHNSTMSPFRIGIAPWDTNALGFNGYLDEVRYWNSILEESTIRDWMHKDLGSDHPDIGGLTLYYKCDEGEDEIVGDLSGNAYGGILTGDWIESTLPFKGTFDLFEDDVRGVWNGQTSASSDIMTLTGNNLEADQTIIFAHSTDANEVIPTNEMNLTRLSRVWRVATQGVSFPSFETQFDLSDVDLTNVNFAEFALLISSDAAFSNPSQVPVELSNFNDPILTIPEEIYFDSQYYTLGFVAEGVQVNDLFVSKEDFKIHPNPGNGQFQMILDNKEAKQLTLKLMNISGKAIFQKSMEVGQGSHIETFDFTALAKGIYLLQLSDSTKSSTRKIVIE